MSEDPWTYWGRRPTSQRGFTCLRLLDSEPDDVNVNSLTVCSIESSWSPRSKGRSLKISLTWCPKEPTCFFGHRFCSVTYQQSVMVVPTTPVPQVHCPRKKSTDVTTRSDVRGGDRSRPVGPHDPNQNGSPTDFHGPPVVTSPPTLNGRPFESLTFCNRVTLVGSRDWDHVSSSLSGFYSHCYHLTANTDVLVPVVTRLTRGWRKIGGLLGPRIRCSKRKVFSSLSQRHRND